MTKISCYIGLRPEFDWSQPDHMPADPHVTLVHIPGVSAAQLYVAHFLGTSAHRIHMESPLLLNIRGAGWWGNERKTLFGERYTNYTSFLYVDGVGENARMLDELRERIAGYLHHIGFKTSNEFRFTPHISVDRDEDLSMLSMPDLSTDFGLQAEAGVVWLSGRRYDQDETGAVFTTGEYDNFVIGGVHDG